ncbi:hypothetical protein RCS94_09500 [Orbaceae bacterium ac157xtp]
MKKIILIIATISILTGCSAIRTDYSVKYMGNANVRYCPKYDDNNNCLYKGWDESFQISLSTKNEYIRFWTVKDYWQGKVSVDYGKVKFNEIDDAIAEINNFLTWAKLPDSERKLRQAEFEKNIKLKVIADKYHLANGVPYAIFYYNSNYFGIPYSFHYYAMNVETAQKALLHLEKWNEAIKNNSDILYK